MKLKLDMTIDTIQELVEKTGINYFINVRVDKRNKMDYAYEICNGNKIYETRNTQSLNRFLGQRVGIVRTGKGKAKVIGEVTIGSKIKTWNSLDEFKNDVHLHMVLSTSEFVYNMENNPAAFKKKYGYTIINPIKYNTEIPIDWDRNRGDNYTYRFVQ